MRKVVCILVLLSMVVASLGITICSAIDIIDSDVMIDINDNENFAEDRVIIVLDNEASLKFKKYTASDFSFIDCTQVVDMSSYIGSAVETAMQNIAQHVISNAELQNYTGIDFNRYNQILCLELETPGKTNVISAITKLQKMDGVLYACPDYQIKVAKTTNDVEFNGSTYNDAYWTATEIYQAWNITTGSNTVRVGVLDTGINGSHPDLSANINTGLSRNFTNSGTSLADPFGHGTEVAGIIGAEGHNSIGVCGVCWDVELVSLKVFDDFGNGNDSYIINAINYAYANNFDILNLSLCLVSDEDNSFPYALYEAMDNFPGLIVCSSGNDYNDNDINPVYPASFELPNLITVGASGYSLSESKDIEWKDLKFNNSGEFIGYSGSNFGLLTVDIFAPGVNIRTTSQNSYTNQTGTSFAAPMVTGVAALMLSANPDLYPEEIKYMLIESADDVNIFLTKCVSGGRLNAYEAVKLARDHERQYCGANKSYHTYKCNDCGFYDNIAHDLYIISEGTGNRALRCTICNFSFQCFDEVTYEIIDSNYHVMRCTNCGYKCIEFHGIYTYIMMVDNNYYHNATCQDCGYTFSQPHSWKYNGSIYQCLLCGKTSTQAPSIMQTLPPSGDVEDQTE